MHHSRFIVAFCSLLALTPARTSAEARDPAAAETLFRRGREAMEAERYGDGLRWFAESQRLDPAPGTLMNLATCEEKLGRLASAWQHWKEALDTLPPSDDRVPLAKARVAALEPKLPRLAVTLREGRDDGARVFRDDVELGPAAEGVLLPVDPGPHTVTVRMPGRAVERVVVRVAEGERQQLEVRPGAVDAATDAEKQAPSAWPRTLGWVMTGVGAAGLGTAVVTSIMLHDYRRTIESDCPGKACRTQEGFDAVSAGQTVTPINTASWIAGGVGLGIGGYLLLTSGRSRATTAIAPTVGRDGFAVFCRGNF